MIKLKNILLKEYAETFNTPNGLLASSDYGANSIIWIEEVDKIYVSANGQSHANMAIVDEFDFINWDYAGRIWEKKKVIALWNYEEFKSNFKFRKALAKEYGSGWILTADEVCAVAEDGYKNPSGKIWYPVDHLIEYPGVNSISDMYKTLKSKELLKLKYQDAVEATDISRAEFDERYLKHKLPPHLR